MALYPRVRELFGKAIDDYVRMAPEPENALFRLANQLEVTPVALNSWVKGRRRPSDEKVHSLATRLFVEVGDQVAFLERWESAKQDKVVSWEEQVLSGEIRLQIRHSAYTGAGRLWADTFTALLKWAGISTDINRSGRMHFNELRQLLWQSGRLDIATGLLATPELLVKLHFFTSPIRYRNNFVVEISPGETPQSLQILRETLVSTDRSQRLAAHNGMAERMVVMTGEIGSIYVERVLGVEIPASQHCDALDAKLFAKLMNKAPGAIAAADEITCLEILVELQRQGRHGVLLYPLVPAPTEPRDISGGYLPYFPLGVAVSRNFAGNADTRKLIEFFAECLPVFLSSHAAWVAKRYCDLRSEINHLAVEALPLAPTEPIDSWLNHCFQLNNHRKATGLTAASAWHEILGLAAKAEKVASEV